MCVEGVYGMGGGLFDVSFWVETSCNAWDYRGGGSGRWIGRPGLGNGWRGRPSWVGLVRAGFRGELEGDE